VIKRQKIIRHVFRVLFFLFAIPLCAQEPLTILHWNDFHSFNQPYETIGQDSLIVKMGGYAILSGYINELKKQIAPVALVHAGDDFQGTPISTITKGLSQIRILNIIKPDVFTLGNHEFDYGKENLEQLLKFARFPIISANCFDKQSGKLFLSPYCMKQYGNLKVGFIGLLTPELNQLTLSENIKDLKILDPAASAKKYMTMIKDSVDLIIIVSHLGIEHDEKLAMEIRGAQIIIGGHSHTALFETKKVNDIFICQAGSRGRYLGRIDLEYDKQKKEMVEFKAKLIPMVSDKIEKDSLVNFVIDSLEQIVSTEMEKVIGELTTDWVRDGHAESNVGNWQADVMREFAGTEIAFQNSGGIRKNMFAGKLTVRDMWELNPFSNNFGVFVLNGEELVKAMERNASGQGEFLQISGLTYKFNPRQPVGKRIVEIKINGTLIDPQREYSVCTNNFVIGIFYNTFRAAAKNRSIRYLPEIDRDVFIEAVKKQKKISSKIEGRIVAVD